MPPEFNFPFVLSVFGTFVTGTVMARLYVWPVLRSMPRYDALSWPGKIRAVHRDLPHLDIR
jgi:hypothetical protein